MINVISACCLESKDQKRTGWVGRRLLYHLKKHHELLHMFFHRMARVRIQRNRYLNQLIGNKDNGLGKMVTGLRRCGRTYLPNELYRIWLLS